MKIFISHSSRDKWAASRISRELIAIGAETFLDEKDIETGESIDDAIGAHLKDSDDVLILLSPASIKSHWVLIEVGGAKALGKRLIPILLYLGANEIPSPISKGLARDINAIEKYYDELAKRIKSNTPPPRTPPVIVSRRRVRVIDTFSVGDTVRLPKVPQETQVRDIDDSRGIALDWSEDMNQYLGRTATVVDVDVDRSLKLDIDNEENWWAFEWLTKVADA